MSEIESTPDVTGPNADEQDFLERILRLLPFEGTGEQLQLLGELWREAAGAAAARIEVGDENGRPMEAEVRVVEIRDERGSSGGVADGIGGGRAGGGVSGAADADVVYSAGGVSEVVVGGEAGFAGRVRGGAGHEINNPVATITGGCSCCWRGKRTRNVGAGDDRGAGVADPGHDGDVMLARPSLLVRERIELGIFLPEIAEKFRGRKSRGMCAGRECG
ncbi:MAG: hypothetical protein U0903_05705 [Planctomycetales bacterium]